MVESGPNGTLHSEGTRWLGSPSVRVAGQFIRALRIRAFCHPHALFCLFGENELSRNSFASRAKFLAQLTVNCKLMRRVQNGDSLCWLVSHAFGPQPKCALTAK
jgi:hypothetical protein